MAAKKPTRERRSLIVLEEEGDLGTQAKFREWLHRLEEAGPGLGLDVLERSRLAWASCVLETYDASRNSLRRPTDIRLEQALRAVASNIVETNQLTDGRGDGSSYAALERAHRGVLNAVSDEESRPKALAPARLVRCSVEVNLRREGEYEAALRESLSLAWKLLGPQRMREVLTRDLAPWYRSRRKTDPAAALLQSLQERGRAPGDGAPW